MKDFGVSNFSLDILETVPQEVMYDREHYWVSKLDCLWENGKGYNLTRGGKGAPGCIYSDDRNKRISKALKGRPHTKEHRIHISMSRLGRFTGNQNPFYGKKHSEDTVSIISHKKSQYPVEMLEPSTLKVVGTFYCTNAAARWLIDNGYSNAKVNTIASVIGKSIRNDPSAHVNYGFRWRLKRKSID